MIKTSGNDFVSFFNVASVGLRFSDPKPNAGRWFNYAGANDGQGEGDDTRAAVGIINNQFEHRAGQAAGALKKQSGANQVTGGSEAGLGDIASRKNAPNMGASGEDKR